MNGILTGDYNLKIIKFCQGFSNPILDKAAEFITMMGEEYFFIVAIAIIFWCVNKKLGYRLGFTLISSLALNGAIKDIFKVPRIFGEEGIRNLRVETATGYSFPSGHTQGSTTFWACIMKNVSKPIIHVLGTIFIVLIAFSRIYLGVHRPIDVIGAILIAMIWVHIIDKVLNVLEKSGNKRFLFIIIIPIVLGLYFFRTHNYYSASGICIGFFIGYFLESKYINFNEKGTLYQNIIKFILGVAVVLLIKAILKIILPKDLIWNFVRYTFVGVWMSSGAPFLFTKLNLVNKSKYI